MARGSKSAVEQGDWVDRLADEVIDWYLDTYCEEKKDAEEWNLDSLRTALKDTFGVEVSTDELAGWGRADSRSMRA